VADKSELIVDLLARNKMGPGASAAARDLDKVGDAAEAAAKDTDKLSRASVVAGHETDKLGKNADDTSGDLTRLAAEIKLAERELQGLARAFARADNAADRLDISKGIRRGLNDIRRLKTSKGILEGILPDPAQAGKGFMSKLGKALSAGGDSIATLAGNHVGLTIGGAIGAAAAPVILTAIGSALSAGAGAGVLGVGIAAAVAKDDQIIQAGSAAGSSFVDSFAKAANKAFKGPIMESLGILEASGGRIAKSWEGAFSSLSGTVVPLVKDVVTGVEHLNDAMVGIAAKSGPALDGLGDSFLLLSDGVAKAMTTLSDGSSEAAGSLVLLTGATADLLKMSTNTLGVFAELSNNAWVTGPLLPLLKKHYRDAADAAKDVETSQRGMVGPLNDAEKAARGQKEAFAGLNTELKKQQDPVFALIDAQGKLKDAQKASAEATEKHGKKSKEAREANRNLAKAALELQGAVGALGKDFDGKLTPAMRASYKAAGLTEDQINAVEREFGSAKKAGDRYSKKYTAAVAVTGASSTRRSLYSVKEVADGIPRTISIAMRITGNKSVSGSLSAFNKNARASGGPVQKGTPYWVGEEGPELILPQANGMVLTAQQSKGYATKTGGGSTMATHRNQGSLRLELAGQQEIVTMFRYLVRSANLLEGRR
jgi:hypothetical protein